MWIKSIQSKNKSINCYCFDENKTFKIGINGVSSGYRVKLY